MTKYTKSSLKRSIDYHLKCNLCIQQLTQENCGLFIGTALSLRDILVEKMLDSEKAYHDRQSKRVYYLSMEFLIGRLLGNTLYNLGIYDIYQNILTDIGVDIDEVREQEKDAGLGNGGLGRLAACFLDSMATIGIPGFGYGIHYEYGLFKQQIDNGFQTEKPDNWLAELNPWEIKRPDEKCIIPIYGRIEHALDRNGDYNPMWLDWKVIMGIPYDIPIIGYGGNTVNWLRLYSAASSSDFDIQIFNEGDYLRAMEQKIASEIISKILYPSDLIESGKELRLIQEYFMVACAIKDIVRRHLKEYNNFSSFADKVAIQMNDTHPSLAVTELMRCLVDEYALPWDEAWDITQKTLSYTNHTVLPEALEKWPITIMERIIPRHLQIIYEINNRYLKKVYEIWPGNEDKLRNMSIIEEGDEKKVRMSHLAIVGSHMTNGVAQLHSDILKEKLFSDFYTMWPKRFTNVTNGITPRRWLLKSNPALSGLICEAIGDSWITNLEDLAGLETYANDSEFREKFIKVKKINKERLGKIIKDDMLIKIDPGSFFDIQAKRIHEYKRQLLKVMHIIYEYMTIISGEQKQPMPRSFVFSGKAAPGYFMAKLIIKLINNVGNKINNDPRMKDIMKVAFIPDYRVSLAEKIIPAANLSEQISMAGTEASGTGNMKFALNGALTIGTMDGANIEILNRVGKENIFIFGINSEEILSMQQSNAYRPFDYYNRHPEIRLVMDSLRDDLFCPYEPGLFKPLYNRILHEGDPYFHLADLIDYIKTFSRAENEYRDQALWSQKAILNIARIGFFSSDRAVSEYAGNIWGIEVIKQNKSKSKRDR